MGSAISQSLKAVATLLNFSSVKRGKMHKRRSVVGAPTSKERGRVVRDSSSALTVLGLPNISGSSAISFGAVLMLTGAGTSGHLHSQSEN